MGEGIAATGMGGIRWGWMRFMYSLNIFAAGVPGLLVLFGPESFLSSVPQDRLYFGVLGSIWLTIGILSVLGLRYPLRFAVIFVVQIVYKVVWLGTVLLPLAIAGGLRADAVPLVIFFLLAIVICLIATPYHYLFGGQKTEGARISG